MIPYYQMTLADIFTETQEIFESDKPEFLKLLESTIDLCEIVPVSCFYGKTPRILIDVFALGSHYSTDFLHPNRLSSPDFS